MSRQAVSWCICEIKRIQANVSQGTSPNILPVGDLRIKRYILGVLGDVLVYVCAAFLVHRPSRFLAFFTAVPYEPEDMCRDFQLLAIE